MKLHDIKNFIWDFDGTLVDSYPDMVVSMQRALAEYGRYADSAEIFSYMMDSVPACIAHYTELFALGDNFTDRFRFYNRQNHADSSPLMLCAREACEAVLARGGRNFIVTNRTDTTFSFLEHHNISSLFTEVVTASSGFPRKPAPDSTQYIVNKYALSRDDTAYIGDRDLDVQTGRAAGILTVRLVYDPRFVSETADFSISGLNELC